MYHVICNALRNLSPTGAPSIFVQEWTLFLLGNTVVREGGSPAETFPLIVGPHFWATPFYIWSYALDSFLSYQVNHAIKQFLLKADALASLSC